MNRQFFFSLQIDTVKCSMTIGIDSEYEFTTTFLNPKNKKPNVTPTTDGYIISYKNIYRGIDIIYTVTEAKIKEDIVIKNRDAIDGFDVVFSSKNCVLFEDVKDKCFKVLGKDSVELFSFPMPEIIYEPHNRNIPLSQCVEFTVETGSNNLMRYRFNKELMKGAYPVKIDPTFIFKTRIFRNFESIRGGLSTKNLMFVTGISHLEEFLKSGLENSNLFSSDDVVFEKKVALVVPHFSSIDRASYVLSFGEKTFTEYLSKLSEIEIEDRTYSYIEIEIPSDSQVQVTAIATIRLNSSVYGDFSLTYERTFTYLPSISIEFSGESALVTKDTLGNLSWNHISVSHLESFKALQYHLLPFIFKIYRHLVDLSDAFRNEIINVESKSPPILRTYFNFTLPLSGLSQPSFIGSSNIYRCQSFYNMIEVILKSAINKRCNLDEDVTFRAGYKYIAPTDYRMIMNRSDGTAVGSRVSLLNEGFSLYPVAKTSFFFQKSEMDDNESFTITENGDPNVNMDHTQISFTRETIIIRQPKVVFLIDSSRSMRNIFDLVKNHISNIVNKLQLDISSGEKKYYLIGYHRDRELGENNIEYYNDGNPLTPNTLFNSLENFTFADYDQDDLSPHKEITLDALADVFESYGEDAATDTYVFKTAIVFTDAPTYQSGDGTGEITKTGLIELAEDKGFRIYVVGPEEEEYADDVDGSITKETGGKFYHPLFTNYNIIPGTSIDSDTTVDDFRVCLLLDNSLTMQSRSSAIREEVGKFFRGIVDFATENNYEYTIQTRSYRDKQFITSSPTTIYTMAYPENPLNIEDLKNWVTSKLSEDIDLDDVTSDHHESTFNAMSQFQSDIHHEYEDVNKVVAPTIFLLISDGLPYVIADSAGNTVTSKDVVDWSTSLNSKIIAVTLNLPDFDENRSDTVSMIANGTGKWFNIADSNNSSTTGSWSPHALVYAKSYFNSNIIESTPTTDLVPLVVRTTNSNPDPVESQIIAASALPSAAYTTKLQLGPFDPDQFSSLRRCNDSTELSYFNGFCFFLDVTFDSTTRDLTLTWRTRIFNHPVNGYYVVDALSYVKYFSIYSAENLNSPTIIRTTGDLSIKHRIVDDGYYFARCNFEYTHIISSLRRTFYAEQSFRIYREQVDEPPTIVLTSPNVANGQTYFPPSDSIRVAGYAQDDIKLASVNYVFQGITGGTAVLASTTLGSGGNRVNFDFTQDLTPMIDAGITRARGTITAKDTKATPNTVTRSFYVQVDGAPLVRITHPVDGDSYVTTEKEIEIRGTASDSSGLSNVSWFVTGRGGADVIPNPDLRTWKTHSIPLLLGDNIVTITARDTGGKTSTDSITITRSKTIDLASPKIFITSPTDENTYSQESNTVTLSGYSTDDVGIQWIDITLGNNTTTATLETPTNITGGVRVAWTSVELTLTPGDNLITAKAYDTSGNSATDTITINMKPKTHILVCVDQTKSMKNLFYMGLKDKIKEIVSDLANRYDCNFYGVSYTDGLTGYTLLNDADAVTESTMLAWLTSLDVAAGGDFDEDGIDIPEGTVQSVGALVGELAIDNEDQTLEKAVLIFTDADTHQADDDSTRSNRTSEGLIVWANGSSARIYVFGPRTETYNDASEDGGTRSLTAETDGERYDLFRDISTDLSSSIVEYLNGNIDPIRPLEYFIQTMPDFEIFGEPQVLNDLSSTSMDFVFLVDTSESMSPHLNHIKETIENLVTMIERTKVDHRLFIGSYKDDVSLTTLFLTRPNENGEPLTAIEIIEYARSLTATGGNDSGEDFDLRENTFEAINDALVIFKIRKDDATIKKQVLFFTDSNTYKFDDGEEKTLVSARLMNDVWPPFGVVFNAVANEYPEYDPEEDMNTSIVHGSDLFTSLRGKRYDLDVSYRDILDDMLPDWEISGEVTTVEREDLSQNIFAGSRFIANNRHGSPKSYDIVKNTSSDIVLRGCHREALGELDNFAILHFEPNVVNIAMKASGYRNEIHNLRKKQITDFGNILFEPIPLTVKIGEPTEIVASFINNNMKFGGVSINVDINGATVFEHTSRAEDEYRIMAYMNAANNGDDLIDSIGLVDGKIALQTNHLKDDLYLIVETAIDVTNLRAVITDLSGREYDNPTTYTSPLAGYEDNRHFQVKIPAGTEFQTISIEYDNLNNSSVSDSDLTSEI